MSEDLLRKLRMLEEDYAGQPLVAQQADLRQINQLRAQLGMPLVDARLNPIGVVKETATESEAARSKTEAVQDHTEAREIYQAYLKKVEELELHRAYADQVSRATAGPGQTPVRPLATMGTNGGPLLCDHCKKPIVLEGGRFNGVNADVAWQRNPVPNWNSWILGGMVVEIQTNGTLRIYHGYPGRDIKQCCNVANRKDDEARTKFESSPRPRKDKLILAFLEHKFPDMTMDERMKLLSSIINTMFSYDPGIGVNRPSTATENKT
jgi:hypothetical protein